MAKNQKQKKDNPILVGILLLVAAVVAITMAGEYVWVLFGVIELPLWVPGILFGLIGIVSLVTGIKEKKAKKENVQ